jgi:hypothetical protein
MRTMVCFSSLVHKLVESRSRAVLAQAFWVKFPLKPTGDLRLGQGRFLNRFAAGLGERVELQILLWRWFFDFPIFEPQAGDAFEFMGVVSDDRQIKCKSLAADL